MRPSYVVVCLPLIALAGCHSDVALGGPNTLVRVDHLPNGPDCPTGGVAIQTGLDTDGDTFLDDSEITSTQLVCNGSIVVQCSGGKVLTGTIAIRSTADWHQLDGVDCVDGELLIAGTTDTAIPDHSDLRTVTGDLVIAGNPQLTSLDGLGQLRELGGTYVIQSNDSLSDISALGQLNRATSIQLIGNDALQDLAGLEPLVDIDMSLVITNNAALRSLTGLDHLRTTTGSIAIRGNQRLGSLAALAGLHEAQLLEISGNDALTAVALDNLQKIDVRLLVLTNSTLASVSLPVLTTIGDFARFDGDPMLAQIDLPALLTAGSLLVTNDNSLTTLAAPALVFATTGVQLFNLPRLTTLGFDHLSSIGDTLVLGSLPRLANLTGFARLQSVGGAFSLTAAGSLHDFTGLGALDSVSGAMTVSNNPVLTSFTGLTRFREVGGGLTITTNSVLPKATSQAFAQRLTVRGTVTIN